MEKYLMFLRLKYRMSILRLIMKKWLLISFFHSIFYWRKSNACRSNS